MKVRFLLSGVAAFALSSTVFAAQQLIVYVSPEALGANQYLRLPKMGVDEAAKALNARSRTYESVDPLTRSDNLKAAARDGASIVVSMGFEFNDVLADIARQNASTKFLALDYCPANAPSNVYCMSFKEQEMSFLAGAEAAWTSKNKKVGAIGGVAVPLLQRYTEAFGQGARYADPKVTVANTLWVGGSNPFSDPARGQQMASLMISGGVDRIMVAAGATSAGVFRAARTTAGTQVIGADINYCPTAPGFVMDNVVKRIDKATVVGVTGLVKGTLQQKTELGLKEDGVTLTGLDPDPANSGCTIAQQPDVIAKLKQLRQKIIDGKVKVVDPMAH